MQQCLVAIPDELEFIVRNRQGQSTAITLEQNNETIHRSIDKYVRQTLI